MSSRIDKWGRRSLLGLLMIYVGWLLMSTVSRSHCSAETSVAARHLIDHEFDAAIQAAEAAVQTPHQTPQESDLARAVYAMAMCGLHRDDEAILQFQQISDRDPLLHLMAVREQGIRYLVLGNVVSAEKLFQRALEIRPDDPETCDEYSNLLNRQGRTWDAVPLVHRLMQRGNCRGRQVMKTAAIDGTFSYDEEFIARCLERYPDECLAKLSRARRDLLKNRTESAEQVLREIVTRHPDLAEAQVRLGRILLEQDSARFLEWHAQQDPTLESHPELWCLRGQFAEQAGKGDAGVRYYLEAVRRYPDHQEANARLAQLLATRGHRDLAERLAQRARDISQMVYLSSELAGGPKPDMIREAAEIMFRNGRYWEAAGWCHTFMGFEQSDPWGSDFLRTVRPYLDTDRGKEMSPQLVDDAVFREFPLTELRLLEGAMVDNPPREEGRLHDQGELTKPLASIRYRDVAADVGLAFEYQNGGSRRGGLEHMLQSTGGGIGACDFDRDGWCDLYFAQSYDWFAERVPETEMPRDLLFRNRRGRSVDDVTDIAVERQIGYGQGVACGDWNSDGFPDLLIANVGRNVLLTGNGDGTFSETPVPALAESEAWSLSAVFADLDHDGLSDLYVVNYLVLEEVLERQCRRQNLPMGCAPTMFAAEQDRLYRNTGDGMLIDLTETSGIVVPDGKGLGVVAADFCMTGELSLFVGNDTTANFFFQPAARDHLFFRETAVASGVAFDGSGNSQSCMGIGVNDADNNGLLDIFVTNFYADANTIYLQRTPDVFVDATRGCNLRDAGFNMLGFGTQFTDADRDSWPDLIVTNGHVDRSFATNGAPDVMPPQFFYNRGDGRYDELPHDELGSYFQQKALGRTVVLLDWNNDGAEDFTVSHLDRPGSLLQNDSAGGNSFQLHLVGIESERIPVGTRIECRLPDGRLLHRQLIGGGGYEGTNDPVLTIGIGESDHVAEMLLMWPDGHRTAVRDVPAHRRITVRQDGRWYFTTPASL
ncbi:MAG: VCBS repeat-containing protein [Planctomycetaceae bacterium]|nr:VCBS repeat-containing protein [Planctomycetaceae bacterium]